MSEAEILDLSGVASVAATDSFELQTAGGTSGRATAAQIADRVSSEEAGVTLQAHSANLDGFASKTAPSGAVVGTSDTQTLTGKTFDAAANTLSNVMLVQGLRGYDPRRFMKYRKALAKVMAGTGRAKVVCLGDSLTAGYGAGITDANFSGGARPKAWPAKLAAYLTSLGIPATAQSFWGMAGLGTTALLKAYDPRLSGMNTSSWVAGPVNSLGGLTIKGDSSQTGTFPFLPTEPVNTFDIYHTYGTGQGLFNANIDGGANTARDCNASSAIGVLTVTAASSGSHTLNIARASGGNINLIGGEAYDTNNPKVSILNMGWGGSKSTDWADNSNPWSPRNAIAAVAPDLTIICLGVNDVSGGTSTSTFQTNMQNIITAALATGDVILCIQSPSDDANWPVGNVNARPPYDTILRALADSNSLPMVDLSYWQKNWAAVNTNGWISYGVLHQTAEGYADQARAFANILSMV